MNRLILAAAALLTCLPVAARAQTTVAPVYQGQDGQTRESLGTFALLLPNASTGTVASVTPAVAAGRVVKASAGNLFGLNVVSGASAGYVLLLNAITIPADGAVVPVKCYALAANTSLDLNLRAAPTYFSTGITVVFSTTGCFTSTASATAFISGDAK